VKEQEGRGKVIGKRSRGKCKRDKVVGGNGARGKWYRKA
jgi:hypothetical protein